MATLGSFLPLILLIVAFYFLLIRPQNKQQKQLQEMRNNMKPGDEIITIGGFYGIVYAVDDKNVVLEMLPDFQKLMVSKTAISRVITEEESVMDKGENTEVEETPDEITAQDDVVEVEMPETEEVEVVEPEVQEETIEATEEVDNKEE